MYELLKYKKDSSNYPKSCNAWSKSYYTEDKAIAEKAIQDFINQPEIVTHYIDEIGYKGTIIQKVRHVKKEQNKTIVIVDTIKHLPMHWLDGTHAGYQDYTDSEYFVFTISEYIPAHLQQLSESINEFMSFKEKEVL